MTCGWYSSGVSSGVVLGRVLLAPGVDLLEPASVALQRSRIGFRRQPGQYPTNVADDRYVHAHVLADFGRVDITRTISGLGREARNFTKARRRPGHANRHDQVRIDRVCCCAPSRACPKPRDNSGDFSATEIPRSVARDWDLCSFSKAEARFCPRRLTATPLAAMMTGPGSAFRRRAASLTWRMFGSRVGW